jgi:P27 family predicted phage terminase small subunit
MPKDHGGSNRKLTIAKPSQWTKAEGSDGGSSGKGTSKPKIKRPPGLSPAAVRFWNRHAPPLIEAGVLTRLDLDSFVQLCGVVSDIEACRKEIDKHGVLIPGVGGTLKRNPAVSAIAQLYQQYRLYSEAFGLTPASRAKLGLRAADLLEAAKMKEAESWLFGTDGEK